MRLLLAVAVLLAGCAGGRAGRYGFDSATSACRQNPALCARLAGEETVVPMARAAQVAASAGATGSVVLRVLRDEDRNVLEKTLTECADAARSEVLLRLFQGKSPTPEECREEVEKDAQGKPVTRAMKLGIEMHGVALACAQKRLGTLRPGGFSLEPRYRYNPKTQKWEPMSRQEEQALLAQGRTGELKGSLVPDVVIHTGNLLQVLAIYDFKFPCVSTEDPVPWRKLPDGRRQNKAYNEALKPVQEPFRIQPRIGVVR